MDRIFIILVAGCLSLIQLCLSQEILINRGIYTFQNKAFRGFLTSHLHSPVVDTDAWRDASSQKFRVVKGYVASAYMLKPTSEEAEAIYIKERQVAKAPSGFGFSSTQYWTVIPADQGFYQLRNLKSSECLESPGLGQQVKTRKCRNSPAQQWSVHSR